VVGDIELFARARARAGHRITGTNGKSTVTTLVGRMAKPPGRRCGSAAISARRRSTCSCRGTGLYVLELSSFQLETTRSRRAVACGAQHHARSPRPLRPTSPPTAPRRRASSRARDCVVVNRDDASGRRDARGPASGAPLHAGSEGVRDYEFSCALRAGEGWLMRGTEPLLAAREMRLRGRHNAAQQRSPRWRSARPRALPSRAARGAARASRGLPHRCAARRTHRRRALRRRLQGHQRRRDAGSGRGLAGEGGTLVLIAGGDGKEQDFGRWPRRSRRARPRAVLIGFRDLLIEALAAHALRLTPARWTLDSSRRPSTAAPRSRSRATRCCSRPPAPALDMFRDYAHRGDVFAARGARAERAAEAL
jgi:UDP-N-acetylmuramoylalanine--D-glutamate ligase